MSYHINISVPALQRLYRPAVDSHRRFTGGKTRQRVRRIGVQRQYSGPLSVMELTPLTRIALL